MKPSEALETHREVIGRMALSHRAAIPRVFGSTARGEDKEGSDLDILVDTLPGATLFDLGPLLEELRSALGVEIDLVTLLELPPALRARVLSEALAV